MRDQAGVDSSRRVISHLARPRRWKTPRHLSPLFPLVAMQIL
jgi:hypothetical protein